ncbi:hypothetical protein AB1283_06935 [Bacillus sp. S13(2024)]|uniref:hypothetical protein n=1 Tax=unclassified Bacillus (in: firmicutes) TaxID=185979 RepID=UPI003D1B1427
MNINQKPTLLSRVMLFFTGIAYKLIPAYIAITRKRMVSETQEGHFIKKKRKKNKRSFFVF